MGVHAAVIHRLALAHHIIEATAAHDALAHIAGSIFHDLSRKIGVGNAVTKAGDHIDLARLKSLLHSGRVGIAVTLSHRLLGDGLDFLGNPRPVAIFDNFRGQRLARLVPAHGQIVQVGASLFKHGRNLQRFLHGKALASRALDEVDRAPTNDDGEIGAQGLAHARNNLACEAGTILDASAVFVGAIVCRLRHEAAHDAANARHNLDGVEASFLDDASAIDVLLLEVVDLLNGHGLEAAHEFQNGDIGGAIRAFGKLVGGLPIMHAIKLSANKAVMLVHGVDHIFLQVGNARLVVARRQSMNHRIARLELITFPGNNGLNNHCRLASGALFKIIRETLGGTIVGRNIAQTRRHRRGNHAVLQRNAIDLQRGAEDWVLFAHARNPSFSCFIYATTLMHRN